MGFENDARSFLCAYYTADVSFDPKKLRKELQKHLPYYMIPACFVKIDTPLLSPNGKLNHKTLPKSNTDDSRSDPMVSIEALMPCIRDGKDRACFLRCSSLGVLWNQHESVLCKRNKLPIWDSIWRRITTANAC